MKYILILLITISFAFGQNFDDTFWLSNRHKVITFGDILDYAEECYNDSTLSNYVIAQYEGFPLKRVWVYEKPTFEGFIEWYKEK